MTTLSKAVQMLIQGVSTAAGRLTATATPGRFPEEERLAIYLTAAEDTARVLDATVYHGWKWYGPWAELTRIAARIDVGERDIAYYGSPIEDRILSLFADAIEPPGHLFVSYDGDGETARALNGGVPPPATRLGFKLFQRGFTWFKDWYYPEGWMEGGQKVQAEKPMDERYRRRHHRAIRRDIETFLEATRSDDEHVGAARERAQPVLAELDV